MGIRYLSSRALGEWGLVPHYSHVEGILLLPKILHDCMTLVYCSTIIQRYKVLGVMRDV